MKVDHKILLADALEQIDLSVEKDSKVKKLKAENRNLQETCETNSNSNIHSKQTTSWTLHLNFTCFKY